MRMVSLTQRLWLHPRPEPHRIYKDILRTRPCCGARHVVTEVTSIGGHAAVVVAVAHAVVAIRYCLRSPTRNRYVQIKTIVITLYRIYLG